ncbi:MAG TPA: integrin [Gammaproteobacteria bacterium]
MNTSSRKTALLTVLSAAILAACGGGGGSSAPVTPPVTPTVPTATTLDPADYAIRQLRFSWDAVTGADYYRMFENVDGASGYTQIGGDITATNYTHAISVLAQDWADASYLVQACNAAGCTDSAPINATASARAIGYFKASNTQASDVFGFDVALSGDGTTLAVGARDEDSAATGIDGNAADNTAAQAGAAYVFFDDGNGWAQQAYIKASNTDAGDEFGRRAALSQDGNTLVIAAHKEDSAATTIDGDANDDTAADAGAVYVFTRNGTTWTQEAYLKAANADAGDNFGYDLAISADGDTVAIGAIGEDSNAAAAINDDPGNVAASDNSNAGSGAVYVFTRSAGVWTQKAYLKADNNGPGDSFGYALALSDDGATLAVGAIWEDSAIGGIDQASDEAANNAGAVYVYSLDGLSDWTAEAYVKAAVVDADDAFGHSISLSSDGDTLAVGANGEDSNAIAIDGDAANDAALNAGAAYVFARNVGVWSQQAYLKAPNTQSGDTFGDTLDISDDGDTLAVGAANNAGPGGEDSAATGIDGSMADNSAADSGAVYLFQRAAATWSQGVYVKAANTDASDAFGAAVSLRSDGLSMAVGAHGESSAATGVSGDQTDDSAGVSGAAYLY